MSLVRLNPLVSTLNRWPNIWDDDFFSDLNTASHNLDVYETDDEVVVKANVAGVAADKVDITFEKGVLWIKAEAEEEKSDKQKKHYSKSSWNYSYKIAVPGMLDFNHEPQATVTDGVVTITFKKAEASKPRKLQVKATAK
ncbi:MAG TPA: Hsp20/alpha crystallin family protein [Vitreimonas sp.]|nr:Hsp20/alpha crystallin family protein [Vitreimonas sp.]